MEPMTLGSPVGSPTSPPLAPTTTSGNTFLPSFLMGDVAPGSRGGGASPTKATRQYSNPNTISTPGSPNPNMDPFFPTRLGPDKPGGPPTQSLMSHHRGNLPQSPASNRLGNSFILGSPQPGSPSVIGSPYNQLANTPQPLHSSTAMFTPGRDQNSLLHEAHMNATVLNEALEDSWVTVFGFPPAAASFVLTQFTQLGTIVEHHNPGSGNWMHLKFQTKLQARKALSKNGKVFSGNIMVGVVTCSDKSITGDKENTANLSNLMSPNISSLPTTPKANIRPLTQAYQTARAEHEVVPKANTPKKNDSLVSKAMQHILGI